MIKAYALILFLLWGELALADWDTSFGFIGRTRALAGQFDATAGYGQVLWGEGDQANPLYGYVRPYTSLRGPTSLTSEVGVDVYPVSFLGVTVGRQHLQRWFDQPEVDCNVVECRGWLNHTFVRVRAVGQYQKVFGSVTYERTDYDAISSQVRPVFQSNNAVMQPAAGDQGNAVLMNVGYQVTDTWGVGLNAEIFKSEESQNRQNQQLAFLRFTRERWQCFGGVGRFYSSPLGTAPQLAGFCTWSLKKKIGY